MPSFAVFLLIFLLFFNYLLIQNNRYFKSLEDYYAEMGLKLVAFERVIPTKKVSHTQIQVKAFLFHSLTNTQTLFISHNLFIFTSFIRTFVHLIPAFIALFHVLLHRPPQCVGVGRDVDVLSVLSAAVGRLGAHAAMREVHTRWDEVKLGGV